MDDTYIKLYRKCLNNRIFLRDHTAWHIFEYLLLMVDRKTGTYETGRFQIANTLGINPNTVFSALRRLINAKMVNTSSNNRFTTISIVNWHEYQSSSTPRSTQTSTSEQQQSNTKQEVKKKEYINNNVETQRVYDLFIKEFEKDSKTYKLTDKRKLKIKARLKDSGLKMLERAIVNTANSKFHRGDNDRGWKADLDFIIRSYEQVEKLADMAEGGSRETSDFMKSLIGDAYEHTS